MAGVREALESHLEKRQVRRDHASLQAEIERLSLQNERLRSAMRRCLTCEYRVGQQVPSAAGRSTPDPGTEGGDP